MSDYDFLSASNGSGDAALMHVMSSRSIGSTSIEVDTTTNIPSKFIATYGILGSDGFITSASKRDFKGHSIDSTHVAIDSFEPGSADNGNASGDVVIIKPNTGWANRVATFIQNMTGHGTPESITVDDLTATGDVSANNLAATGNATIDGSADITGNIVIHGTSRLASASVASIDGSGNITPSAQVFNVTALGAAATILVPSYTPFDGIAGELQIKDDGTARALTWPSGWVAIGVTLPTSTVANKFLYVSYRYSAADSKWHVRGIARQS